MKIIGNNVSIKKLSLNQCIMPNITGHIARGGFPSGEQVGFQPGHHSTAPASTQGIKIKWKWPKTRAKEMTRGKTFQQKGGK